MTENEIAKIIGCISGALDYDEIEANAKKSVAIQASEV